MAVPVCREDLSTARRGGRSCRQETERDQKGEARRQAGERVIVEGTARRGSSALAGDSGRAGVDQDGDAGAEVGGWAVSETRRSRTDEARRIHLR